MRARVARLAWAAHRYLPMRGALELARNVACGLPELLAEEGETPESYLLESVRRRLTVEPTAAWYRGLPDASLVELARAVAQAWLDAP